MHTLTHAQTHSTLTHAHLYTHTHIPTCRLTWGLQVFPTHESPSSHCHTSPALSAWWGQRGVLGPQWGSAEGRGLPTSSVVWGLPEPSSGGHGSGLHPEGGKKYKGKWHGIQKRIMNNSIKQAALFPWHLQCRPPWSSTPSHSLLPPLDCQTLQLKTDRIVTVKRQTLELQLIVSYNSTCVQGSLGQARVSPV